MNLPTERTEARYILCVPSTVTRYFAAPILGIRLWLSSPPRTLMPVPEATVNEYGFTKADEREVGRARQITPVQPKAEAKRMNNPPHGEFRRCVLRFNGSHNGRAIHALLLLLRLEHKRRNIARLRRRNGLVSCGCEEATESRFPLQ